MFHCFCVEVEQNFKHRQRCAQEVLCLDYSNMQERRNTSKYMITRRHWFLISSLWFWKWMWLTVFSTRERERKRDVPIEMSLSWNKVSGCHTKLISATFLPTWKSFFSIYVGICLGNCRVQTWIRTAVYLFNINSNVCKYSK